MCGVYLILKIYLEKWRFFVMYNIYNNLSLQTIWSGTDELTLCCHKYSLIN